MLQLTVLGALGVLLVGALGCFAYLLPLIREAFPFLRESGLWFWVVGAVLSIAVTAILVWLEFCQVWRRA